MNQIVLLKYRKMYLRNQESIKNKRFAWGITILFLIYTNIIVRDRSSSMGTQGKSISWAASHQTKGCGWLIDCSIVVKLVL